MSFIIALLFLLFVANAIAHVVSFLQMRSSGAANSAGVLVFAAVNAAVALLLVLDVSWSQWPALIVPIIGGSGLFATPIRSGQGMPIDYTIFGLDLATRLWSRLSPFLPRGSAAIQTGLLARFWQTSVW